MYLKIYSNFLKKFFKLSRPLKIVCDASDGVVGPILKEVFKNHPKIKLVLINGKPHGKFPAHGPNPLVSGAMDQVAKRVLKEKADLGAVFDADADRIFFVDNTGRSLPSFLSAVIFFKISKPPFVADELVFQSLRFLRVFPKKDIFSTKVGSYFVKSKMREKKANVSAEYSGHFYFKDFFYADSGMMALIEMCNFVSNSEVSISDYLKDLPKFSIVAHEIRDVNFDSLKQKVQKIAEKEKFKIERRDGITLIFSTGFLNLRPSNTEPLIRVTCGAKTKKDCEQFLKLLKN